MTTSATLDASKPRTIKASVLHAAKDLRIESRTLPPPSPTELQVHVSHTGLCGSDLHYFHNYANGDILVREPLSLGHESSGTVLAVGSALTPKFSPGDRVALEVGLPCGDCARCKEGRYNICVGMQFRSSAKSFPHFQGTLQDAINHPGEWCYKLPDKVSPALGALLEPLGVAIHGSRRAQLDILAKANGGPLSILVLGAGAVGLLAAAMAKIKSPRGSTVVIADIDAGRVDFAVKNGFAHRGFVVPRKRGAAIEEKLAIAKEVASLAGDVEKADGEKLGLVDAVFECTGVESCLQAGIYAARPGGRVMLIGMGTPIQTLQISAAALREVDLVGVFRYANTYNEGIAVVSQSGQPIPGKEEEKVPDFEKLVTHRFKGLNQANVQNAFEMAGKTVDADGNLVLKVVIEGTDGYPSVL